MSLDRAFRRLAIQPDSLCRQCRRMFASSTHARQQQSATASVMNSLQNSQSQSRSSYNRSPTATAPASSAASATSTANFDLAAQAVRTATASSLQRQNRQALLDLQRDYSTKDLEKQAARRWKPGDVYAPHDLSGVEMSKWKRFKTKPKPKFDVLDELGINPLDHYKNFSIMSEYVTEMGRIKHSRNTNLRPVNQRKMAKAIRRAMGTGILMPGVHRHPELLKIELAGQKQDVL